ncbi:MAG: carbohydrate-binding domain-containing protein [Ruminococcaceae bacterium]|nr:carbohydrate-binding domain-containing protein [Oscillospiraceae bacterium]
MRSTLRFLLLLLCLTVAFCSCQPANNSNKDETGETNPQDVPVMGDDGEVTLEKINIVTADISALDFSFSDRDRDPSYNYNAATLVHFQNSNCTVTGPGVSISNSAKTVTIKAAGTYVLFGESTAFSVIVKAPETDKVQIVLKGLSLTSSSGPAIRVTTADKVFLTIDEGSVNTLGDDDLYILTENNNSVDAAIYSSSDLTINGTGTLTVNGNFKHGIVSKDDLCITGGKLTVNALKVGLEGKDSVKIGGGTLTVNAGSDGIRSENTKDAARGFVSIEDGTLTITASGDAIQTENVIRIAGGTLSLTAGGGSSVTLEDTDSRKGLKSESDILILGGTLTADCFDDAIHAGGTVSVTGGTVTLSSANDAIHADLDVEVKNGTVEVVKSYEALEGRYVVISGGALTLHSEDDAINAVSPTHDTEKNPVGSAVLISGGKLCTFSKKDGVDVDGSFAVTGGVTLIFGMSNESRAFDYNSSAVLTGGSFAAIGGKDFATAFTGALDQATFTCKLAEQTANTPFSVCDAEGRAVVSISAPAAYSEVMVSASGLQKAETYTVSVGGSVSGADENAFAVNATLTDAESIASLFFNSNLFRADLTDSAETQS